MKIMASGLSTSRQIDGEKMWQTIVLGSKINADVDCSYVIKGYLLLGRKLWQSILSSIHSVLNNRDITLWTKVCLAMVFPVVMYWWQSWTIKKAECWRIDAFKLRCWKRLLKVPWAARRSNQSILKEINTEYSLEGLMLKLQYFGHLMWRADCLEKTLMLEKTEGRRRRGWQRMRWLDAIIDSMDMSLSKLQETVKGREAWHAAAHGITKSRTRWSNWTTNSAACASRKCLLKKNSSVT